MIFAIDVMENRPPTIGVEDGTIEVESLLVEPQQGDVSIDSVMYFSEKIPHNAMDMEEISHSFGQLNSDIACEGGDILSGEVLDAIPKGIGDGYFQLQNDFCTISEDYFSGVAFAESITNLDYGLCEGLHTSVSDSSILTSSTDTGIPSKSDILRIMEAPEYEDDRLNIHSYEFSEIPGSHAGDTLVEKKACESPKSHALENIDKFQDIFSTCSFQNVSSDENGGNLSPSDELFCSSEILRIDNFGQSSQDAENDIFNVKDALGTPASQASSSDSLPAQKRQRKPTQRYIDELTNPFPKHSMRKQDVSSFGPKNKLLGVQHHMERRMKSRTMKFPNEEPSVIAIQVPFGSVPLKESQKKPAFDLVADLDSQSMMCNSKDYRVTPVDPKKIDDCIKSIDQKKNKDCFMALNQKKGDDCVNATQPKTRDEHFMNVAKQKKREECILTINPRKRGDCINTAHPNTRDRRFISAKKQKKRGDCIFTINPKKRDDHGTSMNLRENDNSLRSAHQKKKDDFFTIESPDEDSGRRKHHRLWSISEVRKLIDGVSQYGVGRWSRIKKIFFATSAHRTSVDIKDKWRNLLKASGIQEQNKRQGEKKRNIAWRPLPKSILHRVCELAVMYPYPKGQKPKIAHIHHVSQDESTDITLSDYVRIIRSINGS